MIQTETEDPNMGDLSEIIPPSLEKYFIIDGELSEKTISSLNGEFFISYIMSCLGKGLNSGVSFFLYLLSIVIITAIINSLCSNCSPRIQTVMKFSSSLCCGVAVFGMIGDDIYLAVESIDSVNGFMTSLAPVMSVIYTSSGEITSAAVASTSTLFTVYLTDLITHSVLMPVLRICFCFEIVSVLSGREQLQGVVTTVKNSFVFICGIIMTVLTAVFTYQTVVAQSSDNTVIKTARFAMSSLPIVGGALSEAARTLMGSVGLVKSMTGAVGVSVLLLTVIPPLVYLLVSKTAMTFARIVSQFLDCSSLSSVLKGGEDILSFSCAIMIVFDITAVFSLSVFLLMAK